MTDTLLLNSRKTGKIIQMDYDFITSLDGNCLYCLSDAHVQMILAHMDLFGWRTRWYSSTNTIDMQTVLDLQGSLASALMNPCCNDSPPSLFRFTITGVLQISVDNGTTWTDAPEFDPRNNSTQYPPIPGDDIDEKKCVAANSMRDAIKAQVGDNLTDDMSHYTLGQLINDWIRIYLQTSNPFTAIITIVTNQIFALVIAVLRPALTDEVYDTLMCIFYCNMADNASFSQGDVDTVRGQITDQISGIAGVFFEHLVYLLGAVGMTNLARSQYATSGDCTDCDCPEDCISGWMVGVNASGSFVPFGTLLDSGDDWIIVQSADRGDGTQAIRITQPLTGFHDCNVLWEQLTGGDIWNKAYTVSPTVPTYENLINNPLMGSPFVANSLEFLDGTSGAFTMKFTFSPPP